MNEPTWSATFYKYSAKLKRGVVSVEIHKSLGDIKLRAEALNSEVQNVEPIYELQQTESKVQNV